VVILEKKHSLGIDRPCLAVMMRSGVCQCALHAIKPTLTGVVCGRVSLVGFRARLKHFHSARNRGQ
jgi:hypothetical protein